MNGLETQAYISLAKSANGVDPLVYLGTYVDISEYILWKLGLNWRP